MRKCAWLYRFTWMGSFTYIRRWGCVGVRAWIRVRASPSLTGFAMVVNCVPYFAHPRAGGVHYLDTPLLIEYRREKRQKKERQTRTLDSSRRERNLCFYKHVTQSFCRATMRQSTTAVRTCVCMMAVLTWRPAIAFPGWWLRRLVRWLHHRPPLPSSPCCQVLHLAVWYPSLSTFRSPKYCIMRLWGLDG